MDLMTPFLAISGGLLIGTAAALFLLLSGRVAGVSGMIAAAARMGPSGTPRSQATAFLVGLPIGAASIALLVRTPEVIVTSSVPLLIGAGLLVGFGTRLGNGCTSGHGVCGMARLSPRSLAATATFMASGAAAVFILRHVIGG
ncbi:YeeE/YedE thiosulfate transporter family protein [Sphingosinicella sp. GR2756]|uniref:YeeE/YedE thiosulfate transporter family protein n=1 Tax=Sphingosinicella rhizophila TaxID=3050082 RepID=A0ABU3Q730_9SPHN|nr:YeeE/YedE thiosulfate transporter family protein [Sphingosinicella sp. GR2756]MDT9599127.1 YeeE/YedE thiosulfate transporter family protein [Sphingosinicella sp. GR2756]